MRCGRLRQSCFFGKILVFRLRLGYALWLRPEITLCFIAALLFTSCSHFNIFPREKPDALSEGGLNIMPELGPAPSPEPSPFPPPRPSPDTPISSKPSEENSETSPPTSLPAAPALSPVVKAPHKLPAPTASLAPKTKGSAASPLPPSPDTATPSFFPPSPPPSSSPPSPEPLIHLTRLLAAEDYSAAYTFAQTANLNHHTPSHSLLHRLLVAYLHRQAGQMDRWEQTLRQLLNEEIVFWPLTLEQLAFCRMESSTGKLLPRRDELLYRPGEFIYLRARLRNFSTRPTEQETRELSLYAELALLTPDKKKTSWELLPPDKRRARVALAAIPSYISVPIWFRLPANLSDGPYYLQVAIRDENKAAGNTVEQTLEFKVR